MDYQRFCQLAGRLLRHPTAPYHEHTVRGEAQKICAEHGLAFEQDQFGNALVRLRTASGRRPLVLAAHLDHPGFEIVRALPGRRWLARFCGGVPENYFRPGVPVWLMPGGVPARLVRCHQKQDRTFEVRATREPPAPPRFAVWALENFAVRWGRIHARACDDLIGAAAILATLIDLKESRARVDVIGVLSRAEEIGFRGALALAANRGLPKNSLVISLETSRELPGVKMGQGVILRVGDRTSIFDSEAMRFLGEVAAGVQAARKDFRFQRALMSGGTCEATAYQEFGYQSAAVCVALGNYHNCGERNRIKAEYVSIDDACGMVDLLVQAAKAMPRYDALVKKLPNRLHKLLHEAGPKLRTTAR
jgi:endoglucanase